MATCIRLITACIQVILFRILGSPSTHYVRVVSAASLPALQACQDRAKSLSSNRMGAEVGNTTSMNLFVSSAVR
eukprot:scaffold236189_cov23-Prasinocladus_malaysianus.AAC.1